MSNKKAPTANELIVRAGLHLSPDDIVKRAREHHERTYKNILKPSLAYKVWSRYVEWRLKDLSTDRDRSMTLALSLLPLSGLAILVWNFMHTPLGVFGGFAGLLIAASEAVLVFLRAQHNTRAMREKIEIKGVLATYRESFPHWLRFVLRNIFLSPLDLFLLSEKKNYDQRGNKKPLAVAPPFDPVASIREAYTIGLKRIEEELVGPDSDWSKTLTDLRSRKDKAMQRFTKINKAIEDAKRTENDNRYRDLLLQKDRLKSSTQGLDDAMERIGKLIEATKTEIHKLYSIVDRAGKAYIDADLIADIDQNIDDNERSVDHVDQLYEQVHVRISRQLTAVAVTVMDHNLLPDPATEGIDMSEYLEEIERVAESMVKIDEA